MLWFVPSWISDMIVFVTFDWCWHKNWHLDNVDKGGIVGPSCCQMNQVSMTCVIWIKWAVCSSRKEWHSLCISRSTNWHDWGFNVKNIPLPMCRSGLYFSMVDKLRLDCVFFGILTYAHEWSTGFRFPIKFHTWSACQLVHCVGNWWLEVYMTEMLLIYLSDVDLKLLIYLYFMVFFGMDNCIINQRWLRPP